MDNCGVQDSFNVNALTALLMVLFINGHHYNYLLFERCSEVKLLAVSVHTTNSNIPKGLLSHSYKVRQSPVKSVCFSPDTF